MARGRKGKRTKSRPRVRPRTPAPAPNARTLAAERALLALANDLTALGRAETSPRAAVTAALDALAAVFQRGAPLPLALAAARIGARRDKTRALALAWAREQLRLGLGEILARAAAAGDLCVLLAAEPLAWFVLAACESLADEPPQAAPDRIRLLGEWLTGARSDA
jgi:hypothetical protein